MKKSFNVLFCGTPEFALPTLEALHENFDVSLVISTPDKPRNRGVVTPTPVKQRALELGIPVMTPENINDPEIIRELESRKFDFIVEVAYGKLLKPAFLDLAKDRVLNVHPSLLPLYRGAAPLVWPILNGDAESGVSIMLVDEGMDTGDVLDRIAIPIEGIQASELHDRLANLGAEAIVRVLNDYDRYYQARSAQGESHTYAKKITKDMGHLSFEETGEQILRRIRGLNPWPGTYFFMEGKRIQVLDAEITELEGDHRPGTVYKADPTGIYIVSSDVGVKMTKIKPSGKKEMTADAFLRGHPIKKGVTVE